MDATDAVLQRMFAHQILLKMVHFQTRLFARHKAVDDYLETFADQFDRFFESLQGIQGRLRSTELRFRLRTLRDEELLDYLAWFRDRVLLRMPFRAPELVNIRDEMAASVDKLAYLLSFA